METTPVRTVQSDSHLAEVSIDVLANLFYVSRDCQVNNAENELRCRDKEEIIKSFNALNGAPEQAKLLSYMESDSRFADFLLTIGGNTVKVPPADDNDPLFHRGSD